MEPTFRAWRLTLTATAVAACCCLVAGSAAGLAVAAAVVRNGARASAAPPPRPVLVLDVGSLDFAGQELGSPGPQQEVALTNRGGVTLHVTSVLTTGPYAVDSRCPAAAGDALTLPPGESCSVAVSFAPLGTGTRPGSLAIVSDGGSRTLPIEGTGMLRAPAIAFDEGGVEFSPQKFGTQSPPQLVTVRNVGNATLHVGQVDASGPFAAAPTGCPARAGDALTLAPGVSCVLRVTFTAPVQAGRRDGEVQIVSDAPGVVHGLPVGGLSVKRAPAITFDQASLRFSAQPVGTTGGAQRVVVLNTGRATLHVESLAAIGPFDVESAGCPAEPGDAVTLESGERCTLAVTFSPPAPAGLHTGSLRLVSDAPGSLFTVALEGLGTGGPVQPGAGAAGGGYILVPGAPHDVEAFRERLEFALRVNADGTVRGKQLTFRFAQRGTRYVLRSTGIDRGSLVVTGNAAVFSGVGTVATIGSAGAETTQPGVYAFRVALTDVADPGAGLDSFAISIDGPAGARFHALGTPRAQLPLAFGNLGVRLH